MKIIDDFELTAADMIYVHQRSTDYRSIFISGTLVALEVTA
jgi:hypothetical protein